MFDAVLKQVGKLFSFIYLKLNNTINYMQQNLNFGLNSSLSSITVVGELTVLISSSADGFELMETLISIGSDFRMDAIKSKIYKDQLI